MGLGENEIRGQFVRIDPETSIKSVIQERIIVNDSNTPIGVNIYAKDIETNPTKTVNSNAMDFLNSLTDEKIKILNDLIQPKTQQSFNERLEWAKGFRNYLDKHHPKVNVKIIVGDQKTVFDCEDSKDFEILRIAKEYYGIENDKRRIIL